MIEFKLILHIINRHYKKSRFKVHFTIKGKHSIVIKTHLLVINKLVLAFYFYAC